LRYFAEIASDETGSRILDKKCCFHYFHWGE